MSTSLLSNKLWIAEQLARAFPEASISVQNPRHDDDHLEVSIVSSCFQGKTRVQAHQMVYNALENMRHGKIHALSIEASAPIE